MKRKWRFSALAFTAVLAAPYVVHSTPHVLVEDYPVPGINTEFEYTKQAPHNYSYTAQMFINPSTGALEVPVIQGVNWGCNHCHYGTLQDGSTSPGGFSCQNCHTNDTGANYTLYSAPAMNIHSPAAIAGDPNGALTRGCASCHTGTGFPWGYGYYPAASDGSVTTSGVHDQQVDFANPLSTPALAEGSYLSLTWTPENRPNGLVATLSTDPADPPGIYIISDVAPPHDVQGADGTFDGCKVLPTGEIVNADGTPYVWPHNNANPANTLTMYNYKLKLNGDYTYNALKDPGNWFTVDSATGTVYDQVNYHLDPTTGKVIRNYTGFALDTSIFVVDKTAMAVNDLAWQDVSRWSNKTGPERGLIWQTFEPNPSPLPTPDPLDPPLIADRSIFENEVTDAVDNGDGTVSVTVKGQVWSGFDNANNYATGDFRVFYGQAINPDIVINSSTGETTWVTMLVPQDAAKNDGLGPNGTDSTPDGICQVCHTQTLYWLADGSGTDHNAGVNCLGCHEHKSGFQPTDCNACHGTPPLVTTVGGPDGLATPPTGSVTTGAHAVHASASGYNFDCSNCHVDGMPNTPISGNNLTQIGFDVNGLDASTTAYDGQAAVAYEGTNGTTVSNGGTMTCSNVYCHSQGKTPAVGYDVPSTSPAWDASGPLACDSCHTSPPMFDLHKFHDSWGVSDCSVCHYGTTQDGTTIADKTLHVNGQYDVIASGSFTNHLGQVIPFSFDYSYAQGGGTCSSNSCHEGVHIAPTNVWENRDLYMDASLEESETLDGTGSPVCGSMDFIVSVVQTEDMVAPFDCDYDFNNDGIFEVTNADCTTPASYDYTEGGTVAITWDTFADVTWTVRDANGTSIAPPNPRTEQIVVCPSPNILPTVQGNAAMTYMGNFGVRLTDTSYDPDFDQFNRTGPGRIRINWGDGSPEEEFDINLTATAAAHIFLHNYSSGGGYFVNYSIKDNALSTQWVDSPAKYVYVMF